MATQLATQEQGGAVAAVPEDMSAGLMAVIARAAADPNVDIDKMERLLQMQERVEARHAEAAFNAAMTAAQQEMRPISADADNQQTKSKYASYAQLDKALRPIYTKHGFALSFDEGDTDKPDYVRILCHVSHVGGHTRTYHRDMPADGKGAKGGDVMTKTHAAGAAGSYGARYLLKGIFNVAVGEDDTDGNEVIARVNREQLLKLQETANLLNIDLPKFCAYFKIGSLADISAENYERALAAMNKKGGN